MRNLEKRFVLKTPLDFDDVVRDAIEAYESTDRKIVVVRGYFQYFAYLKIRCSINKSNPQILTSYKINRPETDLPYNKGPYFIEIDCFKFE